MSFCLQKTKKLKQNGIFNRAARKTLAQKLQTSSDLIVKAVRSGFFRAPMLLFPRIPLGFLDRRGKRSDFDAEMFPLCASVQRRLNSTECLLGMHVQCLSVRIHRLPFKKLPLSWTTTICLSVFSKQECQKKKYHCTYITGWICLLY